MSIKANARSLLRLLGMGGFWLGLVSMSRTGFHGLRASWGPAPAPILMAMLPRGPDLTLPLAWLTLFLLAGPLAGWVASGLESPEVEGTGEPWVERWARSLIGGYVLLTGASGMCRALVAAHGASWKLERLPVAFWVEAIPACWQMGAGLGLFLGVQGWRSVWRIAMAQRPRRSRVPGGRP